MAQSISDVVALQLEKVSPRLPLLYHYNDVSWSKLTARKDVEKVSSRAYRIPLQNVAGARVGYFNPAGGALGRGTATHYDVPTLTPITARIAVEINEDVLKQTGGQPQAIRNILSIEIKNAMKEFRTAMNAYLQTDGTGTLATITDKSVGQGGNVTVATTPFYAQLLRPGMIVSVYDSTLATNYGSFTILKIDYPNGVVYATNDSNGVVPAQTVAGMVLVPEGLSGANPVWFFGLPYHISDAAIGTWLNLSRVTIPSIRSNAVDAGSNALTTAPIRLLLRKIIQRVGKINVRGLTAHTHGAQLSAYEELAILVSKIEKGSGNEGVDMLFGDDIKMAGVKTEEDIQAARDRIDFWNAEEWGRIESMPVDFLKQQDGSYFHRPTDSTTGSPIASQLFYIAWFGQIFNSNPASQGAITDLALPAGYDEM